MIEFREGRYYISGPLTLDNIVRMRAEGLTQLRRGDGAGTEIELDCTHVTEVDSSALSMVFEWMRELSKGGRALRVRNPTPSMRSLASVYEVQDLFPAA